MTDTPPNHDSLEEELTALKGEVLLFKTEFKAQRDAVDQAFKLMQQSFNTARVHQWIFGVILAFALAVAAYQTYIGYDFQKRVRENFEDLLTREKAQVLHQLRILPYFARIDGAIRRIRHGSPVDRDSAIWHDLLAVLQEMKSGPMFFDVVLEFRKALPHLRLDVKPEEFRDSYRGEVWICIYLLESQIDEVVKEVKRILPPPETFRQILRANLEKVAPEQREEFKSVINRIASYA